MVDCNEFVDLLISRLRAKKINIADIRLLLEAYRRYVLFYKEKSEPNGLWLVLGTFAKYGKSPYFCPVHTEQFNNRTNYWWKLTPLGEEVMKELASNPFDGDLNDLNLLLFKSSI